MAWYQNVVELIDMRSFSNIWYWIALAVMWSSLSHFPVGVPFDMVTRAHRSGGQAMRDLEDMTRLCVKRRLHVVRASGAWLTGLVAAVLTGLALLGFWYRIQFGQALFLLFAPAVVVGMMGAAAASRLAHQAPEGEALCRFLSRHRMQVQFVGIIAVFVTALWGMWQNMGLGVLMR